MAMQSMLDKNKLNSLLFSFLGSEELVLQWWKSPNKAFDMMTPDEMLGLNSDYVIQYILGQVRDDYS